jgi:hypothetical protein
MWHRSRKAAKPATYFEENQLPTLAEWAAVLDATPNVARPVAIAFFTTDAVTDFARALIDAEAEAERKALDAEIADEERIRKAGGGNTVGPGAAS